MTTRNYRELGDYTTTSEMFVRERLAGDGVAAVFVEGNPNGIISGVRGQMAIDTLTGNQWKNTTDSMVWVAVSGGASGFSPAITPPMFVIAVVTNNWSPAGLASAVVVRASANDNEGSRLTGMDAAGVADGAVKVLMNFAAVVDAGLIVLEHEDVRSAAQNRFRTPNEQPFLIPKYGAVMVIRDAASSRWMVVDPGSRTFEQELQSLQLYPDAQMPELTGDVHNWGPAATNLSNVNYPSGLGLAGGSLAWKANSFMRVLVAAGGARVTGLLWDGDPTSDARGPVKVLRNMGPVGTLTLRNLNAGSLLNHQIRCPGGVDMEVPPFSSVWLYHPVGSDYWEVLSVGVRTDGTFPSMSVTGRSGVISLQVANAAVGQLPSSFAKGVSSLLNGSYDTTTAPQDVYGVVGQVMATRSAGGNQVSNYGVFGDAINGQVNYSGFFDRGTFRVQGDAVLAGALLEISGLRLMYGALRETAILSPPALGAADNPDYAPANFATCRIMRLTSGGAGTTMSGLAGGAKGRVITLTNISASQVAVLGASGLSLAANRFANARTLAASGSAGSSQSYFYDDLSALWREL